ncbi:hypothetical protein [Thermomonospora umbrina]|uniref:Uncharacterized protein n=1 Tax=Thermomonospora umbrina TaxID=111806 RepID=A0A3D9SYV6_9ACTN|nr:hypothetical protein [Thermomonospora umbrina]REF01029.1 hypothetical protein DFJ69_6627 [Thermomonospora umbrina]
MTTRHLRRRDTTGLLGEPALLGIYLNDHLAGATVGARLIRRITGAHQGTPAAPELARLTTEIAEDRRALMNVMGSLGVPVRRAKLVLGWAAELLGRLKPNGRLVRRSPLSSVIELEAMMLGVEGKAACWRTLRRLAERERRLDGARLDALLDRAAAQSRLLEELRVRAVDDIIGIP